MEFASDALDSSEGVRTYIDSKELSAILGTVNEIYCATGGLANYVYKLVTTNGSYYLKHRASHIRSRPDIARNPSEILDEIAAYAAVAPYMPAKSVPALIHQDLEHAVLIASGSHEDTHTLDMLLEEGQQSPETIKMLGNVVGQLHGSALNSNITIRDVARETAFYNRQYQWMVREITYPDPQTRNVAHEAVEVMQTQPKTLIWGDLSPKNVVVSSTAMPILIDLETVHRGDASFDIGYLTGHLLLIGLRRDEQADYQQLIDIFVSSYKHTLSSYAPRNFVNTTLQYAPTFMGTAMIHRTFFALRPEADTQSQSISDKILATAAELINEGTSWPSW